MSLRIIERALSDRYRFGDWNHAVAILSTDFPKEWKDLRDCLNAFKLNTTASDAIKPI